MITNKPQFLLYVEPQSKKLEPTIEDELTKKMRGWLKLAKPGPHYHGVHRNPDGYESESCDYELPTGHWTHSLCVHYLSNHRSEIPEAELEKIRRLPEPTYKKETCIPKDPIEKIKFYGDYMVDKEIFKAAVGVLNTQLHLKGESKPKRQSGMEQLRKKWNKKLQSGVIPAAVSITELEVEWRQALNEIIPER